MYAKVLIITHAYNRPDFIEIQHKTFQKLLLDEYEFIVFNDAPPGSMCDAIVNICDNHHIPCILVPQEIHTRPYLAREPGDPLDRPNIRHCNCIQYSLDTLGFAHQGHLLIIDSDMFLIRPISIETILKDVDIIAPIRGAENRVYYLWPGLTFLAMDRLPNKKNLNFNCGIVNGASVDSGGHTYEYLTNNMDVRWENATELFSYELFCPDRFVPDHLIKTSTPIEDRIKKYIHLCFTPKEIIFLLHQPHTINFCFGNRFLHYRAGTNYDHQSKEYDEKKTALINEFIQDILSE